LIREKRCEDQSGFGGGVARIVDQYRSAVCLRVAMDQCADIVILGDEYSCLRGGFSRLRFIARICCRLRCISDIVTDRPQGANRLRHDIGIEAHPIRRRFRSQELGDSGNVALRVIKQGRGRGTLLQLPHFR